MYKESFFNNYFFDKNGSYFVYNSFTKARIKIDKLVFIKKVVRKANETSNTALLSNDIAKYFHILFKNGFIVNRDINELVLLQNLYYKNYFDSSSLNVVLMPTLDCNFSCPYCFEKSTKHLVENNKDYFTALEKYFFENIHRYKRINLSFFGGEPLLVKNKLFDLAFKVKKQAIDLGIKFSTTIVTNGSLITEKVIDNLIQLNCKSIQVTFDGGEDQHNKTRCFINGNPSYLTLIENIHKLGNIIDDENTIILRFNLNSTKIEDVEKTLMQINPLIRKKISLLFRLIFDTPEYHSCNENSYSQLDDFHSMGKKMGFKIFSNQHFFSSCEACGDINSFHVLPNLTIWKCINDLSFAKACIGNIQENGQANINMLNVINWFDNANFFSSQKCRNCKLCPDCLGGCIKNKCITGKNICSNINLLVSEHKYR